MLGHLLDAPEEVHDSREHHQQDTASWSESQHLWQETLVQRGESFLLRDRAQGWPGPVVLRYSTNDLGAVLNSALDHIHWGVEYRSDRTSNAT